MRIAQVRPREERTRTSVGDVSSHRVSKSASVLCARARATALLRRGTTKSLMDLLKKYREGAKKKRGRRAVVRDGEGERDFIFLSRSSSSTANRPATSRRSAGLRTACFFFLWKNYDVFHFHFISFACVPLRTLTFFLAVTRARETTRGSTPRSEPLFFK